MMFFETSAKSGQYVNLMMYTAISELPFFSQFDIDKETLIKELESLNSKNVQNSIYDIVKDKKEKKRMWVLKRKFLIYLYLIIRLI